MQIDPLPQERDILRSFIRDATHVILKNQHSGRGMTVGGDFLDIDHRSVCDSANLIEPCATLALNVCRALFLAAKEQICGKYGSSAARKKGIETKGKHIVGVAQEQALYS